MVIVNSYIKLPEGNDSESLDDDYILQGPEVNICLYTFPKICPDTRPSREKK